jgi:hypothetical protein
MPEVFMEGLSKSYEETMSLLLSAKVAMSEGVKKASTEDAETW